MAEGENNCNGECSEIYSIQDGHIKQRMGDEKILGSKGQFCAAFYHVHEWGRRKYFCLDEDSCIIAKGTKDDIMKFAQEAKRFAEKAKKLDEELATKFHEEAKQFAAKKLNISAREGKEFVEKTNEFAAKSFDEREKKAAEKRNEAEKLAEEAEQLDEEAKKATEKQEKAKQLAEEARKLAEEVEKATKKEKKTEQLDEGTEQLDEGTAEQLAEEAQQRDKEAKKATKKQKKAKQRAEEAQKLVEEPVQRAEEAKQLVEEAEQLVEKAKEAAYAWHVQAKTVVAVVKFEKDGKILYEARYTNCGEEEEQKHAEDFFKEDIEKGKFREKVKANPNGTITMYLTIQPCNKSTSILGTATIRKDKTCCETLKKIFNDILLPKEIKLCVKTANLCPLSLTQETDKDDETLRQKAVEILMGIGVKFSGMKQEDWHYLLSLTNELENCKDLEVHEGRKDLDASVQSVFDEIQLVAKLNQVKIKSS